MAQIQPRIRAGGTPFSTSTAGQLTKPKKKTTTPAAAPKPVQGAPESVAQAQQQQPVANRIGTAVSPGGDTALNTALNQQQVQGGAPGAGGLSFGGQPIRPGYTQYLYDNPQLTAQMVMQGMGLPGLTGTSADFTRQYGQFAPAMAGLQSMSGPLSGMGEQQMLGLIEQLLQQGLTPGGQMPDSMALLNMLLNPSEGLSGYLYGTPGAELGLNQQYGNVGQMLGGAISGLNPFAQQMMTNALQGAQSQYQQAQLSGAAGTDARLGDYLRQNLGGLMG